MTINVVPSHDPLNYRLSINDRLDAVYDTRRLFWSHGITTCDLTHKQFVDVYRLAYVLMKVAGLDLGDYEAWGVKFQVARKALGVDL